MKKIYFVATVLALAACSMNQKPAPYDVYGTTFYGKNSSHPVNNNHPTYHNDDALDTSNPDYNSQIDQRNANAIVAKPIGGNQPSKLQSSAVTSSNGITTRPLGEAPAIDGNEQVVKLNSGKTLIHSGSSTTIADNYKTQGFVQHEETVPPVQETENAVNPAEKNAQRNADEKLSHLKPIAKPPYTPQKTETVETTKPKITPKITKAETSTIGKPIKADVENNDVADSSDVGPETAAPVKKIPVEAERAVDNEAAKIKRETAIATQKATDQAQTVPPVEKPAVIEKAEPEISEAAPLAEAPIAAAAKPKSQFIKPVDGAVVSEFGGDSSGGAFNDGINIQAPEGTPVKASATGTVVYSGNQLQGYGNMVIVKHSNGFLTAYSHLKGLEVKKGDAVGQGDVIGHVGKTGNVSNPQLHFGIRKGREPVDPKDYL